jgi:hypothetical protein
MQAVLDHLVRDIDEFMFLRRACVGAGWIDTGAVEPIVAVLADGQRGYRADGQQRQKRGGGKDAP